MGVFGEKSPQIKSYLVEATQKDLSQTPQHLWSHLVMNTGRISEKATPGIVARDRGSNKCTLKIRTSSDGLVILSGGLNSVCVRVCVCVCVCIERRERGWEREKGRINQIWHGLWDPWRQKGEAKQWGVEEIGVLKTQHLFERWGLYWLQGMNGAASTLPWLWNKTLISMNPSPVLRCVHCKWQRESLETVTLPGGQAGQAQVRSTCPPPHHHLLLAQLFHSDHFHVHIKQLMKLDWIADWEPTTANTYFPKPYARPPAKHRTQACVWFPWIGCQGLCSPVLHPSFW